ncbi:MAG: hypothetical protein IKP97_00520 [Kiritimatiellae bacterium]|nr:hypothetical protein [Kiritimatiellia bacterium]
MKTNHIIVRPDRLNRPLAVCYCGKLSSAVFVVEGDLPDDLEALAVLIGRTPENNAPRSDFVAAAHRQDDGSWRCYLSPFYFPDASESLEYHIVGADTSDNPRWLGTGSLVVRDCPANGSSVTPEVLPRDAYVYNPVTGKYHKLVAEADELGNISVAVEQEGVDR